MSDVKKYTVGKEIKENLTQYYGLNSNGDTVYVAMSAEEVRNYAKKHPKEDIVKIEDSNYNYHSLVESLKRFDRKEFDENCNTYELEMLFESVKTTLSAQQKNDLARFVRKAKTAEEVNTYMTGMVAQDRANESLNEEKVYSSRDSINKNFDKEIEDILSDNGIIETVEYGAINDVGPKTALKIKNILDNLNYNCEIIKDYDTCQVIIKESFTEDVDEESFNKLNESLVGIYEDYILRIFEKYHVKVAESYHDRYYPELERMVRTVDCFVVEAIGKDFSEKFLKELRSLESHDIYLDIEKEPVLSNLDPEYEQKKNTRTAFVFYAVIDGKITEAFDEESFNKLKEIAYELDDYIEDKVWVRDFWYDAQFDNTITFSISGDWKHDHARFDYYAKEWLDNKGLDYKIWQHVTDDDGSDSYVADHTIRIYNL